MEVLVEVAAVFAGAAAGSLVTYISGVLRLKGRVESMEKWRRYAQQDLSGSVAERKYILKGVLACLKGLQEKGCNGPVTESIRELEEYMLTTSHQTKSYAKEGQS